MPMGRKVMPPRTLTPQFRVTCACCSLDSSERTLSRKWYAFNEHAEPPVFLFTLCDRARCQSTRVRARTPYQLPDTAGALGTLTSKYVASPAAFITRTSVSAF